MIDWRPIADLPEALKDGRQVLLWSAHGADVGTWTSGPNDWDKPESGYFEALYECVPCEDPTHFAPIDPPAASDFMREDDADFRSELEAAFDKARSALSASNEGEE